MSDTVARTRPFTAQVSNVQVDIDPQGHSVSVEESAVSGRWDLLVESQCVAEFLFVGDELRIKYGSSASVIVLPDGDHLPSHKSAALPDCPILTIRKSSRKKFSVFVQVDSLV